MSTTPSATGPSTPPPTAPTPPAGSPLATVLAYTLIPAVLLAAAWLLHTEYIFSAGTRLTLPALLAAVAVTILYVAGVAALAGTTVRELPKITAFIAWLAATLALALGTSLDSSVYQGALFKGEHWVTLAEVAGMSAFLAVMLFLPKRSRATA